MKSLKMTSRISLFFLLVCCGFLSDIQAQKNKKVADLPDNCEIISLKLNLVADTFNKIKEETSFLVIIAGATKKVSPRYNSNRISDAVKFLTKFHSISSKRIVVGIGLSSSKLAYLKFYVRGELVDEIKIIGKGRLCFGMGESFEIINKVK